MKEKSKHPLGRKPVRSQVKVRRANYKDKNDVLEISRDLWGGHDYLPEVWDEWLRDKNGRLLVATIGKARVGVAHAYFQAPDVAWLEGLRVHPKYRGLGIGGKLNKALTKWAAAKGAKVARLCTGSSNTASRRHIAKVDFGLLQEFQRLDTSKRAGRKPSGVTRPRIPNRSLWDWLLSRPELFENRGMYSDGWTWHPLSIRSIRRLLQGRRILATFRKGTLSSLCIISRDDRGITLGFGAGSPDGIRKTIRFLRGLLRAGREERLRLLMPKVSPLLRSLGLRGFEKKGRILVFEKFLV